MTSQYLAYKVLDFLTYSRSYDMRDFHKVIIDNIRKMVGGQAICFQQYWIFKGWLPMPEGRPAILMLSNVTIHQIRKFRVLIRYSQPHNVCLSLGCSIL